MTVTIKNVGSGEGWGRYVLGKSDNRPGATVILGDAELGDAICKTIDYKSGNSVNFVISFADEDGVTQEQGRTIVKEFMQSFMDGFNDDEYHLDLVEHNDTNHLHYHARIPKVNLLTNTQLKLYWHKSDLEYKKAVIADICHKHGLVTGVEMKNTVPNPLHKLNQINKWREEHSQEPLDLASPKLKRATEKKLSEYISEGVKAGLINSLDEVKAELLSLGLDIPNEGYDRGKEFHYLTIENESGKTRLRGDIYSAEFYGLTREDRQESVRDNRSFTTRDAELRASGTDVKQALQRERVKRAKFIKKQYGNARKRAIEQEIRASITADREQEQRNVTAVGIVETKNTQKNVSSGQESVESSSRNDKQNDKSARGHGEALGQPEQRENQLHMALDNDVLSVDSGHRMGFDISQPKPTDTKEREQRDNYGTSEREAKARVRDREVRKWSVHTHTKRRKLDDRLHKYSHRKRERGAQTQNGMRALSDIRLVEDIKPLDLLLSSDQLPQLQQESVGHHDLFRATARDIEDAERERGELNDSLRAEINDSIRATAGSFYRRIETDNSIISREHGRSTERDREAEQDVGTVWEHIKELADKHQSRTVGRIGEEAEREGAELDGAVSQTKREQSTISKGYAELEKELSGAVGSVGDKVGGLRGAIKRLGEFIGQVIEKAKRIVIKKESSVSQGNNFKPFNSMG